MKKLLFILLIAISITGYSQGLKALLMSQTDILSVTTTNISNIDEIDAKSGGVITGVGTITQKGVCWSEDTNPTITGSTSYHTDDGSGTTTYTSDIHTYKLNTTYYVRAYITESNGTTTYGNQVSFTTGNPTLYQTTTPKQWFITQVKDGGGVYYTSYGTSADVDLAYSKLGSISTWAVYYLTTNTYFSTGAYIYSSDGHLYYTISEYQLSYDNISTNYYRLKIEAGKITEQVQY